MSEAKRIEKQRRKIIEKRQAKLYADIDAGRLPSWYDPRLSMDERALLWRTRQPK